MYRENSLEMVRNLQSGPIPAVFTARILAVLHRVSDLTLDHEN
jgi:hypothetical protein